MSTESDQIINSKSSSDGHSGNIFSGETFRVLEGILTSPSIEIIVQPPRKVRYRYETEQLKRSAGTILAKFDSNGTKNYPKIKIKNYESPIQVVVSCVSADEPYKPHYHKIVSKNKDDCKNGALYKLVDEKDDMTLTLTNVGIQRTKKEKIQESLDEKKKNMIDPFKSGYNFTPDSLSPHSVRLCFEAYIKDSEKNIVPLKPVVSEVIFNDRPGLDLVIHTLSHSSAPTEGGMKMILLCDKVDKDNINVVFSEYQNGKLVWHDRATFQSKDVHKQCAITLKTPPYKTQVREPVKVKIQLFDAKRKELSEPYDFMFTPLNNLSNKKKRRLEPDFIESLMENISQGRDPDLNYPTIPQEHPGCSSFSLPTYDYPQRELQNQPYGCFDANPRIQEERGGHLGPFVPSNMVNCNPGNQNVSKSSSFSPPTFDYPQIDLQNQPHRCFDANPGIQEERGRYPQPFVPSSMAYDNPGNQNASRFSEMELDVFIPESSTTFVLGAERNLNSKYFTTQTDINLNSVATSTLSEEQNSESLSSLLEDFNV